MPQIRPTQDEGVIETLTICVVLGCSIPLLVSAFSLTWCSGVFRRTDRRQFYVLVARRGTQNRNSEQGPRNGPVLSCRSLLLLAHCLAVEVLHR